MTASQEPGFTLGIEEKYRPVDPETRNLPDDPPASPLERCHERVGAQLAPGFWRSRIEVGSRVCTSIAEPGREPGSRPRGIIEEAESRVLAMIAAASHPALTGTCKSRPKKTTTTCLQGTGKSPR